MILNYDGKILKTKDALFMVIDDWHAYQRMENNPTIEYETGQFPWIICGNYFPDTLQVPEVQKFLQWIQAGNVWELGWIFGWSTNQPRTKMTLRNV